LAPWLPARAQGTSASLPHAIPPPTGPKPPLLLWDAPGPARQSTADFGVEYLDRNAPENSLRDRLVRHVESPCLYPFPASRPNGLAALIIPGGGYKHVVIDKEGFETAAWLAQRGVNAYVLLYRLPADGWVAGSRAPLEDAQRALQLVRARAAIDGHAAHRVFVQGFSAGGHLAAWLATGGGDPASPRPDAAVLLYPVIKLAGPFAHAGSAQQLLGESPSADALSRHEPDRLVDPATPPALLIHALDDTAVPPENSVAMMQALRNGGHRVESHFFEEGGHGFGLRFAVGKPVAAWPTLALEWVSRTLPAGVERNRP
jgi:acetyl esterase/lipase